jgi:hypothetical protein
LRESPATSVSALSCSQPLSTRSAQMPSTVARVSSVATIASAAVNSPALSAKRMIAPEFIRRSSCGEFAG